jgi:hypothetical protein
MTTEELASRIERLERSGRRWRASACTMALALVAIVAMAQSGTTKADVEQPARDATRTPVSLSVVIDKTDHEVLYRLWSDGSIERTRSPIFDFRGNDKWDLLRRP